MKTPILLAIGCSALLAQIGQYPPGGYPPGTYPPGTYPPGQGPPGTGPSIPRRSKKSSKSDADQQPTFQLSGYIRNLSDKSLDLEGTDARFITIQLSDKTTKPDGLKAGDTVDIEATRDQDSQYHAVSIKINPKVKRNADAAAQEATEAPQPPPNQPPAQAQAQQADDNAPPPVSRQLNGPLHDSDDNGPPVLKRGRPKNQPEEAEVVAERRPAAQDQDSSDARASSTSAAPLLPAEPNVREVFLEKARNVAGDFLNSLPNYVCQEYATRYVSSHHADQWSAQDVVSADLVYDDHKESYKNLAINGKPIKGSPEQTGAWSTGELGTIMADLFSPATAADFHYMHDDTISRQQSSVYDFDVDRPHSHWKVSLPAEFIYPAYQGSIWLDKKNARVLRIEMQAKEIPDQFSLDTVESAVDYDYVSLGSAEKFLLPVHAETLSCVRSSNVCEKNVIEFRNYHKFTGESIIKFGDSKQ